jgi:hypothetical protein
MPTVSFLLLLHTHRTGNFCFKNGGAKRTIAKHRGRLWAGIGSVNLIPGMLGDEVSSIIPEWMTVGEALRAQNVAHGLPADGGETDRWFHIRIGPFTIRLPNPPARQRAVFFHDTNHLLTGYDTVFSRGEMEIAAWEIASGCGIYWFAWFINLAIFAVGLTVCPRAMFRAFLRGRRIATSMYRRRENRSTLTEMTVADLRALIGAEQRAATAHAADRIAFVLWAIVAVTMMLVPVMAVLLVIFGVRRVV